MQNETGVQLACDILAEHFGDVVAAVGRVLLERGASSLQDIMRFLSQNSGDERLDFQHARNAMLTLIRHGVVIPTPLPKPPGGDGDPTAAPLPPQAFQRYQQPTYTALIDMIFARMRYPHYLEHVRTNYGEIGYQLLFAALRHGRVLGRFAVDEACQRLLEDELDTYIRRSMLDEQSAAALRAEPRRIQRAVLDQGEVPECRRPGLVLLKRIKAAREGADGQAADGQADADADAKALRARCLEELYLLQRDQVLLRVEPTGAAAAPAEAAAREDPRHEGALSDDSADDAQAGNPSKRPRHDAGGDAHGWCMEAVYCCDKLSLDLCLCKNLVARFFEERMGGRTARVLASVLTRVKVTCTGADARLVSTGFMPLDEIEAKIKELGGKPAGGDPEKERQTIEKTLHSFAKTGLMAKRETRRDGRVLSRKAAGAADDHPDRADNYVEWAVVWKKVQRHLWESMVSQFIEEQFGKLGLRVFNSMMKMEDQPQKLDEQMISRTCLIDECQCRKILNQMALRQFVNFHELQQGAETSHWFYYVDEACLKMAMLQGVVRAILNLRTRFRAEGARVAALGSQGRDGFTAQVREGYRIEDILERSFLVLNAALIVLGLDT